MLHARHGVKRPVPGYPDRDSPANGAEGESKEQTSQKGLRQSWGDRCPGRRKGYSPGGRAGSTEAEAGTFSQGLYHKGQRRTPTLQGRPDHCAVSQVSILRGL